MTTELANPPTNGVLKISREEAVKLLCARIEEGVRLRKARMWTVGQLDKAREMKQGWTLEVNKLLTRMFGTEKEADEFNRWAGKILPEFASLNQFIERFHDEMDQRLKKLVAVLRRVEASVDAAKDQAEVKAMEEAEKSVEAASHEEVAAGGEQSAAPEEPVPLPGLPVETVVEVNPEPVTKRAGVMILHTRDEAVEESLTRFVTMLGYDLVVVGAEEVGTKALVQRLSDQKGLEFAIMLAGRPGSGDETEKWEFELGYCAGRLGAGRVCVLHVGGMTVSYDDHGLLHIPVDPAEGWQLHLARQLKRAGIRIDLNRLV